MSGALLATLIVGDLTITIAPATQFISQFGNPLPYTFSSVFLAVSGGHVSSYTWGFTGITSGTWVVTSGQGTNTAVATLSNSNNAAANFNCTFVIEGVTHVLPCFLSYS